MNRPRIVAIISAVAASTAAFVVTSRYHLGGTLAGAVLVPVVIILVSHTSSEGVDALHKWARRRRELGVEEGGTEASTVSEEASATLARSESASVHEPDPFPVSLEAAGRRKASVHTQWLLVCLSCMSVAVSVYALVAHDDPTVVRETVIERITESTHAGGAAGSTSKPESGGTTPTTVTTAAADPVTTTTDATATTSTTVTGASETTTTSTAEGTGGSSTTNTTQTTGISLP